MIGRLHGGQDPSLVNWTFNLGDFELSSIPDSGTAFHQKHGGFDELLNPAAFNVAKDAAARELDA